MRSCPLLAWSICLCLAAGAAGHGMMVSPRPRTGTRNAGNNKGRGTAPCGRGGQLQTQGSPVATYEPGQSVNVQWRIDAAHGGNCRISLSTSGGGVPSGMQDLTGNFPCARRGGADSKSVTIPQDASCENCVLQWYWRGDADYYNCMDVSIKKSGPPPTTAPPPPTPAPKPMPPVKTDEPWQLWKDGKCLVVKDDHMKGVLSIDAELTVPGVKSGDIDAEHDGGHCSAFHAHPLDNDISVFRLCECKPPKYDCMCANKALTFIKSCDSEGTGSWEVRIEDRSHQNKDQLFHQKPNGANCLVSDETKCMTVSSWKPPSSKPGRRRRRRNKPAGDAPAARRRRRGKSRRRSKKVLSNQVPVSLSSVDKKKKKRSKSKK